MAGAGRGCGRWEHGCALPLVPTPPAYHPPAAHLQHVVERFELQRALLLLDNKSGRGHAGQEASAVSRPCGRAGVATPLLATRRERTPAPPAPRTHPLPLPLRLTLRAPHAACPRAPHTAPLPPTTLPRQTLCLLACVSWKDRMTTTGCRFCVKKRSLIWALTSVSPATCQDGWARSREGGARVGQGSRRAASIWALTSASPATCGDSSRGHRGAAPRSAAGLRARHRLDPRQA